MTFASPLLLLALVLLPLLWWLLRATPPAPRTQDFPAVRLLLGMEAREETPDRTPPWLLALRLLAAAALLLGLAGPTLARPGNRTKTGGPLILVVDNGWASAPDWSRRLAACDRILAAAGGRPSALLATARAEDNAAPALTAAMPAGLLRERLAALRPLPWPVDRADATRALLAASERDGPLREAAVDYVADGIATADDGPFLDALRGFSSLRTLRDETRQDAAGRDGTAARLLLPPRIGAGGTMAATMVWPAGTAVPSRRGSEQLLALDEHGDALARSSFGSPHAVPGSDGRTVGATAVVPLPVELRNQLARLVVAGSHSAASTVLLDESDRRRPVGLVSADPASGTPLVGSLYYLERAFPPGTPIRTGTIEALLDRPLSVLVVADGGLEDPATREHLLDWVRRGGTLIRFAGPRLAAETDEADSGGPDGDAIGGADGTGVDGTGADGAGAGAAASDDALLPVALLPGSRALGGAMSWGKPQHLAPFARNSPFAGLPVPAEVTVSRQVLARPSVTLPRHTWASLADGTPIVTDARLGEGRTVLFHVTANAEWSNLPLSVLFVEMLDRLTRLAAGVPSAGDRTLLAPLAALDAFGQAGAPTEVSTGIPADAFGSVPASPLHPPGIYGAGAEHRALNLADALPLPASERDATPPGPLTEGGTDLALGAWLVAASLGLLAVDLAIALALRGLLPRVASRRALPLALVLGVAAATLPRHARAAAADPANGAVPAAALQTELAYVVTGNDEVDRLSREGLSALSDIVNARTAATLGAPAAVVPGRDDLALYPLLYWPILPDAALDRHAVASLDAYMRTGGIVLIDTEGGDADAAGSGAGFAPGVGAALRRVTAGLDVPPLSKLTADDVLAHTFYLLRDFPGRFDGAPVWVQRRGDPANDGVSPVIVGANDWAASWAVGPDGNHELAVIPGGDEQRTLSIRFGVNLVMYALTGSYKADQVHVPAILQRLGESAASSAPEEGE